MPIIDTLCNAFRQAIDEYETEVGENISEDRRRTMDELRTLLDTRQQARTDSLALRREMERYVETIPVNLVAFYIPFLDTSRLRKNLRAVLAQPHFEEAELTIAERAEIREDYQAEIRDLKAQIAELSLLLEAERAKDNVRLVNQLTLDLEQERKNYGLLNKDYTELQQSMSTLKTKFSQEKREKKQVLKEKAILQQDYEDLKAKYEALLQANASRNEEHTQVPPGNFFN